MNLCKFFANLTCSEINQFQEDLQLQDTNMGLFNFFKLIETSFTKFCKRSNVFHLVLNDMSQYEFPFSYNKHVADVLAHVVNFYLQYRMRQFVKTMMADLKEAN